MYVDAKFFSYVNIRTHIYTRAGALYSRTQAHGMANKYRAYNAEISDVREMLAKYARLFSHPDLRMVYVPKLMKLVLQTSNCLTRSVVK